MQTNNPSQRNQILKIVTTSFLQVKYCNMAKFKNTNDDNTSRRFLSNSKTASQITRTDKTLIHRFKVILETVLDGYVTDVEIIAIYIY